MARPADTRVNVPALSMTLPGMTFTLILSLYSTFESADTRMTGMVSICEKEANGNINIMSKKLRIFISIYFRVLKFL